MRGSDAETAKMSQLQAQIRRMSYDLAQLRGTASNRRIANASAVWLLIAVRRLRDSYFPLGLFGEPGWDILLALHATELEGGTIAVSAACEASGAPPTEALRVLSVMEGSGLVVREPDTEDPRRCNLRLTADASIALRRFLAALDDFIPV